MLRNTFYDRKKSQIHHWFYNSDGEPEYICETYRPYLYVAAPNPKKFDAIGIDDVPLIKKEFEYDWQRRNFAEQYKQRLYYNISVEQQFLLERYFDKNILELTKFALRTFYYDIEVIADEFPDPETAKFPITSITIYDTHTQKFYVWGINPYNAWSVKDHLKDIEPEDVIYDYCKSEKDLLTKLIRFWRANYPDLLVGYNSYSFDLPYIVHRIDAVFGKGRGSLLSPINYIYGAEKYNEKFAKRYIEYTIGGISHIDYMLLYKTFTPGERESDSLDYVCTEELKEGKLDYGDTSLQELCYSDWNKFINYNIWDVDLLVRLDAEKKYLDIARFSAFSGFCNMPKALEKTSIITGCIAKLALQKNKVIYTQMNGRKEDFPGGYVKQPPTTMKRDVVSFDANSLYPSTMITLNISPEKKVGEILSSDEEFHNVYFFNKKETKKLPIKDFPEILKRYDLCISECGIIFSQKGMGLVAEFCDELYTKRKNVRAEVAQLEAKLEKMNPEDYGYSEMKTLSSQKDIEQYLYKILLNSAYGAFANPYFSLYDLDCAKSVTTTGQAMIRKTEELINNYISSEWGLEWKDRVTGIDTDSNFITIEDIREKYKFDIIDQDGNLTPEFVEVENKISNHINTEIQLWAREKYNSKDPRFFFKRESVCLTAIWTGKKHYILHLVNKEGKKMNKFKYSGLTLAKSAWSKNVRQLSKDIVEEHILKNLSETNSKNAIYKLFDVDFKKMDYTDIAERGNIKVLNKWEDKNVGLKTAKGTTGPAKSAIYFNELLKLYKLENKYPKIVNGSKMKTVFVKENIHGIDRISFQDILPPEFNLEVDYDAQFFKGILKSLEPIYEAVGWKVPNPKKQVEFSLEDLFG